MTLSSRTFSDVVSFTRGTGATRISPTSGFIVGVDFSTTSNTIGTGSKTFTLTADANVNREWSVGENVIAVSQAGATGTMTGTVTSYTPSTQALVINVPTGGTTGSGTSTDWRIGSLEVRRDSNGVLVEGQATNLNTNTFTAPTTTASRIVTPNFTASPDGSVNAYKVAGATNTVPRNNGFNFGVTGISLGAGGVITFFAKTDGASFVLLTSGANDGISINLVDGSIISASNQFSPFNFTATAVANGFIRISVAAGAVSGGGLIIAATTTPITNIDTTDTGADGVKGVVFYGVGTGAGSFIPTRGISVTRAADSLSLTSSAVNSIRQGESTVVVTTQNTDNSTAQKRALRLTGPTGEIRVGKQGVGTTASFTKMVEGNGQIVRGAGTTAFKDNGLSIVEALANYLGTPNQLTFGGTSSGFAFGNNKFMLTASALEIEVNSDLTTSDVRGLGPNTLNGTHYTGSRFVITTGTAGTVGVSIDGTSYRRINTAVITQPCNEVTSGLVGGITRVVMVGNGGGIYTSDDQGETWTARTSGVSNIITGVTFGNGRFVAAIRNTSAANQSIITSTDGITWTGVLTGQATPNTNFNDVSFGNNVFVAVADSGVVWTSPDGTMWTSNTNTNTTAQLLGVTYATNLNIWVAVGVSGTIITATDPSGTWTVQTSGSTAFLNEVGIFNNEIYAVGTISNVLRSTNGTTWSTVFALSGSNFNGIAASPSIMLLSGNSGWLYSSTDGTTFTSRTNNGATLNGIAFGNNRFVSVGNAANGSGYIATIDADGTVTRRVSGTTQSIAAIFYEPISRRFIATTRTPGTLYLSSTDFGVSWAATNFISGTDQYDICFGGGFYVTVGFNGAIRSTTDFVTGNSYSLGSVSFFSCGFGNGIFVAANSIGQIYTTTNPTSAANWTLRTSGTTQNLTSVLYSTRDNCWYAAGTSGTLLVSYDNAVTWRPVQDAGITGITDTTLQANATAQVFVPGTNRIALSYKANRVITSINGHTTISDTSASIPSITGGVIGDTFNGYITSIRFDRTAYDAQEVSRLSNGVEPDLAINDLAANALGDQLATDAAQNTLNA